MGYESRLYVVSNTSNIYDDNGMKYGEVIAKFNLSCIDGELLDNIKQYNVTDTYIFDNGEKIVDDKYGDKLTEIPIKDMISLLADMVRVSDYRRYKPCLSMLLGFELSQWDKDLVVLHYGY